MAELQLRARRSKCAQRCTDNHDWFVDHREDAVGQPSKRVLQDRWNSVVVLWGCDDDAVGGLNFLCKLRDNLGNLHLLRLVKQGNVVNFYQLNSGLVGKVLLHKLQESSVI